MTIWNLLWILLWTPRKGRRVVLSVDGNWKAFAFTEDSDHLRSIPQNVLLLCSDTESVPNFARDVRVLKLDVEIQACRKV